MTDQSEKPALLITGNSNVGKSTITRLLLPHPKEYKGKSGKKPGSTLLIKSVEQEDLPFKIVDLPGFGYLKSSSRRREEHVKNQIISHVENHHHEYFFALVVLNILRIEDEIEKYFIKNDQTIPLSFEMISFLHEFQIPILVVLNKVDKVSIYDRKRILDQLIESSWQYGIKLIPYREYDKQVVGIPYLELSALKHTNLGKLKKGIYDHLPSS